MHVFKGFKFVTILSLYMRKNSPLREFQRCNKENFSTNKTKENWRVINDEWSNVFVFLRPSSGSLQF